MHEEVIYSKNTFEDFLANEKPINYLFSIVITFFVTLSMLFRFISYITKQK
jgi:hypothetical protein